MAAWISLLSVHISKEEYMQREQLWWVRVNLEAREDFCCEDLWREFIKFQNFSQKILVQTIERGEQIMISNPQSFHRQQFLFYYRQNSLFIHGHFSTNFLLTNQFISKFILKQIRQYFNERVNSIETVIFGQILARLNFWI